MFKYSSSMVLCKCILSNILLFIINIILPAIFHWQHTQRGVNNRGYQINNHSNEKKLSVGVGVTERDNSSSRNLHKFSAISIFHIYAIHFSAIL